MTKQDLENIREIEYDIRKLKAKFDELNSRSLVGSPVPSASRSFGVSDKVARIAERKLLLAQEIAEKEAQLKERLDFINGIFDDVLREIVCCRCVYNFSWQKIAEKVGGNNTEGSIRMAYNRFMDNL
jgi:hypothetical protein